MPGSISSEVTLRRDRARASSESSWESTSEHALVRVDAISFRTLARIGDAGGGEDPGRAAGCSSGAAGISLVFAVEPCGASDDPNQ